MATSKTYRGATKDDAVAEAALDLGCSAAALEVLEVVTRTSSGDSAGWCEVRVRVPDRAQGLDAADLLEGFPTRRAAERSRSASIDRPAAEELAELPRGGPRQPDGAEADLPPSPHVLAGRAETFLRALLQCMGLEASLDTKLEGENVNIEILAEKGVGGLLIGRQGQTLDAIQYLVNRVVLPGAVARGRIYLDTEGYREKYRRKIEELAHKYRDEALRAGRPVTLEEFSSRDRWIIHQALLDDPRVTTRSVGEGEDRKLMIIPRR